MEERQTVEEPNANLEWNHWLIISAKGLFLIAIFSTLMTVCQTVVLFFMSMFLICVAAGSTLVQVDDDQVNTILRMLTI